MNKNQYLRNEEIRKVAHKLYLNLRAKGLSHFAALTAVIDFVLTASEVPSDES